MTRPVRVLIADDHAAIRAGLRLVLEATPDI
jgi:DNA-binding NarL/FixJ family response regulator